MFIKHAAVAAFVSLCLPAFAAAQEMKHDHKAMQQEAADSPSSKAYEDASAKMHRDMTVSLSGDADIDFVRGMIPHHQGAIDMAVAYLRYGHNEQLRRIAQEIIVDQQQEIAAMRLALGQPLPVDAAVPTQTTAATAPAPSHHSHSSMSPGMMMSPLNKTK